ncbi:cytochrome P450 [Xylariomycetidae sp. FL2044]|nr:cytochrome P450 [Xylariomycetidae sp. FL2044]
MPGASLLSSLASALVVYAIFRWVQQYRRGPLPPGPRGLPLVGNIKDLPPEGALEWTHWLRHKEQYGPISSVTVLGQVFVIIHDKQAVFDLLESRALKSASRPRLVFAGDVVGYRDSMGMMPYGPRFRLRRKLTETQVSRRSIKRFEPVQEVEVLRFLRRLVATPDKVERHLDLISGSIMLRILYNYETDPEKEDPLTEDDVYRGYRIPKGAVLFPALAWLAHDPAVYHDPGEFQPERFLEPRREPPASEVVFGFGRRACPGKWIAEQNLFLSIAQTLAVFNVVYQMLPGVISRVKPFPHKIVPRSERHRRLVE